ncbi:MAG: hypothetical protein ERJ67_10980 [Aphanocapsa feldmannii 277cV]|uniref:Uncharacterized protein n=2 Tax=Aphanocapsa feldmannii TaxID=192050 RepID=A0A524RL21_9CHRO|nr:MAG: hypothetical protein ERJ67_10980 [Aphanocapsa feldmannii 277cV]TGH20534.1 MAG: hypothetical protein ERJ68_06665 [Aphanocapsa feldmannii 277cI]
MNQPSPPGENVAPLPPFRSATEFPRSPRPDKAHSLYPECLQALSDANEARRILRARKDQQKDVIVQMRTAIKQFEDDIALESKTRIQLHSINKQLFHALQEMEDIANDMTQVVDEAHRIKRTGLRRLIEKLKEIVRHWRAFKQRQTAALANRGEPGSEVASDD